MDPMKELERQVERLLGELTDLRRTNRLLAGRVKKLEKAARDSGGAEGLARERDEIRRRVSGLVERLAQLDNE